MIWQEQDSFDYVIIIIKTISISDESGIPLIAWPFILSGGWCILFRWLA